MGRVVRIVVMVELRRSARRARFLVIIVGCCVEDTTNYFKRRLVNVNQTE